MLRKNLLFGFSILALLALVALPVTGQAQEAAGPDNFIFVNHIGQDLYLDLDDQLYTIPAKDGAPEGGRLTLTLEPGEHKFAANVPGVPVGWAGEFTIEPGQAVAKAAWLTKTEPVIDSLTDKVLEEPKDRVYVTDFDPTAPTTQPAQPVDTWQPVPAEPGKASIAWINHDGVDELTVDLAGQLYQVPPKVNDVPGRVQIHVEPGTYNYTASVPYGSINGQLTLESGQVVGISVVPGIRQDPIYEEGEEVEIPPVELNVYQEDLTAQAATAQPAAPPEAPAGDDQAPTEPDMAAQPEGLLVKNYAGETMTFTINNQAYTIAPGAEQTITLSPGRYTYTASLPFVATTGEVTLSVDNPGAVLSIVATPDGGALQVYQE